MNILRRGSTRPTDRLVYWAIALGYALAQAFVAFEGLGKDASLFVILCWGATTLFGAIVIAVFLTTPKQPICSAPRPLRYDYLNPGDLLIDEPTRDPQEIVN